MFVTAIIALIIIVVIYYIFEFRNRPCIPPISAVEIDPEEHIYVHPDYVHGLKDHREFNVQTLYEVIKYGASSNAKKPLFCFRKSSEEPFQHYTYEQVYETIHQIGSGIIDMGLKPTNDTFIGIYGSANVNYVMFLYALWPFSFVSVGLYDSLGKDGVKFIVKHAELQMIFADELVRVKNILEWKEEKSTLKVIVSLIEVTDELKELAKQKQVELITYKSLIERGKQNPHEPVPPTPADIAMIMYTSGSTGEPKGCVITHEGIICSMVGVSVAVDLVSLMGENAPRVLNFMPLAHLFGCGTCIAITYLGGTVGFWQGKVDKLMDDFRDFKPTLLTMVPRLLNKLYDRVMSETRKKGLLARGFVKLAVKAKLAHMRRGNSNPNTIWDYLLFNAIRQRFGGQINRVVSTSAPLSPNVADFCRAAFSCIFIEAYGQTECTVGCWQTLTDMASGEVGVPTPVNYLKLIDVPEKDYYAKNGVGEICLKSPAVFKCYLKDEEKTRETIDEKEWLHTGDVGQWTKHNTLKIIDRKKNMYKLSQGEYIAPEKIEEVYGRSHFISQIYVYGNSFQSFPVAIIALHDEHVKKWAKKANIDETELNHDSEKLKEAVLQDMTERGKKGGLMSYEQVKKIGFIKEPFTIENGLLTPTFKARRYAVEKKYKQTLEDLYKGVEY
ncbi:unnamed protein product [Didymodactylos carnosus]|uniref:long-chain-fatty-acid--CoA ligase n=1 Tax=Didymodactylos carnosus TaxID=1234261 RepID=A0A813QIR0_9BILA|nr:unnamed protein product [Didymodactylos carnosus]CAF0868306.1 unnamed protein product [Didymodactylos carnosus]CAF3549846.1 unnamed protein product [Didymodactylos carnosus]CAF3653123.1 unnamed protein product [Didymodactylos carnosus]